ncbi:MAG TPA: BatA domain-containing protein [Dongiaceae bacterium]|nr:BatA domain-containing protein [Dongiaceae bacterium]
MIPLLTYPLALLALASVPALAAIYILRNRFRRRQVSSLLLWQFQVQSKSGGAKIHRLQLPLLFFLELLALVLLVAAATGPQWKLPQSARPLVVILDDSFSLQATRDGVSARARARDYLKRLFDRQPPPATRLILAGAVPRSLALVRTWREVDAELAQWQCQAPGADLNSAVTLAAELGRQQANILVLTDHKPAEETISNPRLQWAAFGVPQDNFAIVNASRTAFGDEDRCLLEVANFSDAARTTRLLVQTGTNAISATDLALGAHEDRRLVFNLPSGAPALRAELENDALTEDNTAQLLPPIRHRVRVLVALADENLAALANRTLDATGLRATISADPELVIHETDTLTGTNCWSLQWTGAAASNAYTGPFILDNSQPLAAGMALNGVVWAAGASTNAPGDLPVILAGNIPLVSTREDAFGLRHLTLNLNPGLSTVQDTPDWPILFWNILSWRIAEMPGLKESNTRLGAAEEVKTTGGAVTLWQPDGGKKFFAQTGGDLALETPLPGIYFVVMDNATNQFAVNPLAADESDLAATASGQWGKWNEATERRLETASAVWIFGLAALALLTAHLYFVAAARGGGR